MYWIYFKAGYFDTRIHGRLILEFWIKSKHKYPLRLDWRHMKRIAQRHTEKDKLVLMDISVIWVEEIIKGENDDLQKLGM